MIKHRLRELTKSFGSHVDPEKTAQLKRTKIEIENNVTRIRKLIKNEDQGKKEGKKKGSKKESELLGLIEDFYKEYQSLYALYDHLIRESEKIVTGKEDSDSEYYSSDEIVADEDKAKEHRKAADSIKQELETTTSEVAALKLKLTSTSQKVRTLKSEHEAALSKVHEKEIMNKELKTKADEREKELLALVQAREANGDHLFARNNELEGQLANLKAEMDSIQSPKRHIEEQKEDNASAKELMDKNIRLHTRISELELTLKERENENCALLDKLRENEKNSTQKIAELMEQTNNMQMELDSLHAHKGELEQRLACQISDSSAEAHVKCMQQELDSLCQQKTELEEKLNEEIYESMKVELTNKTIDEKQKLETKMKELTLLVDTLCSEKDELQIQMTNKNSEIDQLRLENESLHSRVLELEASLPKGESADQLLLAQLQVDSLCNQKEDLEKQMENKSSKIDELKNLEKDSLNAKVLELEKLFSNRGEELQERALQVDSVFKQKEYLEKQLGVKKCENDELRIETESLHAKVVELEGSLNEREEEYLTYHKARELEKEKAYVQIMALTAQVNDMEAKIDNVELQSKKKKQECSKTLPLTEHRDTYLASKIAEQLKLLKEEEIKASKIRSPQNKPNLQVFERKMEDLAEKCRINIEDNIRILSRRILVAEQLQTENKENYRKIKVKYEKENEKLKDKIATYEAELKKIKSLPETLYVKENELLKYKIATYEAELKRKSSVPESPVFPSIDESVTDEIKQLKHNMNCLVAQLNDKEECEVVLKEKVLKLEAEISNEGGKNVNSITQLKEKVRNCEKQMKEMNESLLSLGDEKREAIKQLCILIDYHRSRFDDLKQVKTNFNLRRIRTTT